MRKTKKIVPLYGKCRLMEKRSSGASVATDWFDLAAEMTWDEAVRNVGRRSSDGYWVLGDKLIVLDLNQASSPAA